MTPTEAARNALDRIVKKVSDFTGALIVADIYGDYGEKNIF